MESKAAQRVISLLEKAFSDRSKQRVAGAALGRAVRSAALEELAQILATISGLEAPVDAADRAYVQALKDVAAGAVRLSKDEEEKERLHRAVEKPLDQALLLALEESAGSPKELMLWTGKEAAPVSRGLARLRELELVESWASVADKRSKIYRLTPLGRDVASTLEPRDLAPAAESAITSAVDFFEELRATGHVYMDSFEERLAARLSRGRARTLARYISAAADRTGFVDLGGRVARLYTLDLSTELDRSLDQGRTPDFLAKVCEAMDRGAAKQLLIRADRTRDRWVDLIGSIATEEVLLKVVPSIAGRLELIQPQGSYFVLYESSVLKKRDESDACLKNLGSRAAQTWVYDDGAVKSVS